ncbi:MAG: hypothetical protein HY719_14750 [Planctomycetes bacterium]|nr:hypothetical protein [Planctomycetota bacterium]
MKDCYLKVTYCEGRALAAYYYLPRRQGDRSARTEVVDDVLVVDYAPDGRAIGVEIVSPTLFDLAVFNRLLQRLGVEPVDLKEVAALVAA